MPGAALNKYIAPSQQGYNYKHIWLAERVRNGETTYGYNKSDIRFTDLQTAKVGKRSIRTER